MAKLVYYYGAMNSGKSIALMKDAYNLEEKGYNTLLIKSTVDTKGDNMIVSRIGLAKKVNIYLKPTDSLLSDENLLKYEIVSLILVDEAQFLTEEQIEELWKITKILDIPVNCYGLRTDFTTRTFTGSKRLFELADYVEELKNICECMKLAKFNARKVNGKYVMEGESVVIDGEANVEYVPLCGKCYMEKVMGYNIQKLKKKFLHKKPNVFL